MVRLRLRQRQWQNVRNGPGVKTVEVTDNAKLGPVSATYVAQASCPHDCPFLGSGCYGEYGPLSWQWKRIGETAKGLSPLELAETEANLVSQMSGAFPLRLHVVGDSTTREGTRLLAKAAARYSKKRGQKVWAYTHAWARVTRRDWGRTSVLASCESIEQVKAATRKGYATALVVAEFAQSKTYDIGNGFKLVPCPAQTKEAVTCSSCRLCWDDDRLRKAKLVIGFEAHGSGKRKSRMALPLVEN